VLRIVEPKHCDTHSRDISMKQPSSLLSLASARIIQHCYIKGVRAAAIQRDLKHSVPKFLLNTICHNVTAIQRSVEVAARTIRRHFIYYDQRKRLYTGRKHHWNSPGACHSCLMIMQRRRFQCAPPKLRDLIENKMYEIQMHPPLLIEGIPVKDKDMFKVLLGLAEVAVHKWIDRETDIESCRKRKDQEHLLYDPFEDRYKYASKI